MNDLETPRGKQENETPADPQPPSPDEAAPQGPSLTLLYTILVLALGAAIFLALLIVLPFWRRH
jgi:hypothetical protein